MSISSIVSLGFGSWGSISLVTTLGYGTAIPSIPTDFICFRTMYGATAYAGMEAALPDMTASGVLSGMTSTGSIPGMTESGSVPSIELSWEVC
jgi:hypothetical protein